MQFAKQLQETFTVQSWPTLFGRESFYNNNLLGLSSLPVGSNLAPDLTIPSQAAAAAVATAAARVVRFMTDS